MVKKRRSPSLELTSSFLCRFASKGGESLNHVRRRATHRKGLREWPDTSLTRRTSKKECSLGRTCKVTTLVPLSLPAWPLSCARGRAASRSGGTTSTWIGLWKVGLRARSVVASLAREWVSDQVSAPKLVEEVMTTASCTSWASERALPVVLAMCACFS